MSDHFVKNPLDAVKVGDTLEFRIISLDNERRRISLSRKSGERKPQQQQTAKPVPQSGNAAAPHEKRVRAVVAVKAKAPPPPKDDDGTMYNPFAEAFKKKKV